MVSEYHAGMPVRGRGRGRVGVRAVCHPEPIVPALVPTVPASGGRQGVASCGAAKTVAVRVL